MYSALAASLCRKGGKPDCVESDAALWPPWPDLPPSSALLRQNFILIAQYLSHQLGPSGVCPGSLGLIHGLTEQQAVMLVNIDVFRRTAVLALICACAEWLFKKPAKRAKVPPGVR